MCTILKEKLNSNFDLEIIFSRSSDKTSQWKSALLKGNNILKKKFMKLKRQLYSRNDRFIMNFQREYIQNNYHNIYLPKQQTDNRRICFVSILGIFKTWKKCPPHVLYSAILIVPLKKSWIEHPTKYENELESVLHLNLNVNDQLNKFIEFIQFLQWKHDQRLIFCMLDDYEIKYDCNQHNKNSSLVAPFWYHLSKEIQKLYDPVTKSRYKSIHLDEKWYYGQDCNQKFKIPVCSILAELYFMTMKFKTIQEILYQSNNSLNPVQFYGEANYDFVKCTITTKMDFIIQKSDEKNEGEWHISVDYMHHNA